MSGHQLLCHLLLGPDGEDLGCAKWGCFGLLKLLGENQGRDSGLLYDQLHSKTVGAQFLWDTNFFRINGCKYYFFRSMSVQACMWGLGQSSRCKVLSSITWYQLGKLWGGNKNTSKWVEQCPYIVMPASPQ